MSLQALFKEQRKLNEVITANKKLNNKNLFRKKILALIVEGGELANEWRGFKYWSRDREPRTHYEVRCEKCFGRGYNDGDAECISCNASGLSGKVKNPLLEEYVDNLHFILELGNDLKYNIANVRDYDYLIGRIWEPEDITAGFIYYFRAIDTFNFEFSFTNYKKLVRSFFSVGRLLGFTWDEIERAYYKKNEINHKRQKEGY